MSESQQTNLEKTLLAWCRKNIEVRIFIDVCLTKIINLMVLKIVGLWS